jgi:hypothetical protein
MTPNFNEGTDKTHSIGVPDFVGEPIVKLDEWEVLQLEPYDPKVRNWIDCDGTHPVFTCEELGDTEWHRNKSTPNEPVLDELELKYPELLTLLTTDNYYTSRSAARAELVKLIALVRADDAREILGIIPPNGEAWFIPEMKRKFFAITDKWEGK